MTERNRGVPLQTPRWPAQSRPVLPEGQDRAPTRDANPGLSCAVGANRLVIPEGAELQIRRRAPGGIWSVWEPLPGSEIEFRVFTARGQPASPKVELGSLDL